MSDAVPATPSPRAGPARPSRIGRYPVQRVLGEGSFGVVYLARDDDLQRDVAIKVPTARLLARPGAIDAYLREARIVASLRHEHIVRVFDFGRTEDGTCYIVSEYVEGGSLAGLLTRRRPTAGEAASLVADVAQALHHAHGHRLVHRDVKPGNLLLNAAGKAYLADFGIALRDEDFGTGGGLAGTPWYMSPEQARGESHRVDGRADIYSLGAVLYELLTGQVPFRRDHVPDLLADIASLTLEVRPPRMLVTDLPRELERICLKALAKRASERYPNAHDFADDLRAFLAQQPPLPAAPVGPVAPAGPPPATPDSKSAFESTGDRAPGERLARVVPKGLRAFDAGDRDFFLELLPGPRDRHGLPDSIRFWKRRIEAADPEQTFAVGLLYGPSGCGKSSLVRAGLLPRLGRDVVAVYVEAAAGQTEARLLRGLARHCPGLDTRGGLVEALAALRCGEGPPPAARVLLVLDQFEQFLHAHGREGDTELVRALRQCDGARVQALLLVRDDFWLAVTRFLAGLEIDLVQGHNTAVVDLFDPAHARKVLAAFGHAHGRLAENPAQWSREQQAFLDQAVAGLVREGRVVPVRLALFAEMVKGRPWEPATLKAVGGTEGIGVSFLEESFSAPPANPRHRLHQKAVRGVLRVLLPERGTDIKGSMRSAAELEAASGYAGRPKEFADLMHVLDELRLVTPTDPEGAQQQREPGGVSPRSSDARYYQLTHDYLVPSVRAWLRRKQTESWRGRAEIRLEDRAALWQGKCENRHLPTWWEWLNIRLFTHSKDWTEPQRRLMRQATRYHLLRGAALAILLAILTFTGLLIRDHVVEQNNATHAAALVRGLLAADTAKVKAIITDLEDYRPWADPLLRQANAEAASGSQQKLNTALALLPVDPSQRDYLCECLLDAAPAEVPVLRKALSLHQKELRGRLWEAAEHPPARKEARRLRAAAALALYDPDSNRWDKVRDAVAADLVSVSTVYLPGWLDALRPARDRLIAPLITVYRDAGRRDAERSLAADLLAEYVADRPDSLADLLPDADERAWSKWWPKMQTHRDRALVLFEDELKKSPPPDWKDAPLNPAWGQLEPALVGQIEAAAGMVDKRFALVQTLPLAEFDKLAETLSKAGYRLLRFRPYGSVGQVANLPGGQAGWQPVSRVAAIWTRDGQKAEWASGLTAAEVTKHDVERHQRELVPLDVTGYLIEAEGKDEARYTVLWGPKDAEVEDVKMYAGLSTAGHPAAFRPLQKGNYVPRSSSTLRLGEQTLYSAVWVKLKNAPQIKEYNFGWAEAEYETAWTPSHLQTDLRLIWNPSRLGLGSLAVAPPAGLGGIPWAAMILGQPARIPGVDFAAVFLDSATHVSKEIHGLDPAAHLARCRELAAHGYRPAALTALITGGNRTLTGSVWHRPVVPEEAKDALAKRQAQAAVALLQLGAAEKVWPLLEHSPDPRLRSFLIHRLAPLGTDPHVLLRRLDEEREVSRRRALLLALGTYPAERLKPEDRAHWQDQLRQWYRTEPDAGLHGAVEWLLRRWGEGAAVVKAEKEMACKEAERKPGDARQWYVNGQGQTLVKVPAGGMFWMGSPGHEARRNPYLEPLHQVRISRSFAIAAKEVTVAQFLEFRRDHRYFTKFSPRPDGPIINVNWYQAAEYCNWLSKQEGLPEEEWCYLPNDAKEYGPGMRLARGYLGKKGYRLPTEAEWEYACRAGAVTRWYYGHAEELFGEYAWYSKNTNHESARTGGLLKPNDLGLFDLHGNVWEWVLDPSVGRKKRPQKGKYREDIEYLNDIKYINNDVFRLMCGASFVVLAPFVRSAERLGVPPSEDANSVGFRVARTYP
jgi:formylglycine-generating enzyme required for sulfatase activity